MEMILLDWTRMGKAFCLAGVVIGPHGVQVVRPLPARQQTLPLRNVGWTPWLLEGHRRWEVFELVGPEPAEAEPPHLEDVWVRGLRPYRRTASAAQRRAILQATAAEHGAELFGAPLVAARATAHLPPGEGCRSLATLVVSADRVHFSASYRDGAAEVDYRVVLGTPPADRRQLPVKDHHLLLRAEKEGPDLGRQIRALDAAVRQMGGLIAVRLGLTRAYQTRPHEGSAVCWLMADGFFSLADPQDCRTWLFRSTPARTHCSAACARCGGTWARRASDARTAPAVSRTCSTQWGWSSSSPAWRTTLA
jgi:hypothetical protein